MGSTTIRVDTETHAQLVALSRQSGTSLVETVRAAAEALRRQRFARSVAGQIEALRSDPAVWQEYLDEADGTAVSDGIGR